MDMMTQMMDQMPVAANAQVNANRGAANKSQSGDGGEFDSMVRQKRGDAQETQKNAANAKNAKNAPKTELQKAQDNGKTEQKTEQEIPDEQYAMAAAMMFQMQPNVTYAAVPEEVSEQAQQLTELAAPMEEEASQLAEAVPEMVAAATEQPALQPVAEERAQFAGEPELREDIPAEHDPAERRTEVREDAAPVPGERRAQRFTEREDAADEEIPEENIQPEAPVFDQVDAVPVRVAEPSEPLPLEAEDAAEQLSARIESVLTGENGESRVELTLTPESLGTVRVEITHTADGAIHIQLGATTERAMRLLERHTGHLQNLLTTDARPAVQVTVRGGEEARQQFLNPNGENSRQQQQQQNRQQQQRHDQAQDFLQQLRLGLVGTDE